MTTVTIRILTVWLSFATYTYAADTRPMLNGDPAHDSVILHSVQRPEDALALLPEDSALATGIIAAWLQSGSDSGPEVESAPAGEVIPPPPVVRVGGDVNCQFSSIQAAIDAASSTVEIRVARDQFYTAQELVILNKDITLRGGFADCSANTRTLPNTVLDGAGNGGPNDRKPVIRILSTGNLRTVRLEGLTIQGGLTTNLPHNCSESDRNGAGLNIHGRMRVFLTDVTVRNNRTSSSAPSDDDCSFAVTIHSNTGGGIYFNGGGHADSLLQLNAGVVVADNAASGFTDFANSVNHGGGIACRRGDLRLAHHAIAVARNSAGTPGEAFRSFGGGIYLDDCRFLSEAGGLLAGIFENETFSTGTRRDGGGIFARNSELVFRKHPLSGNFGPAVVANRSAGDGGGIRISDGTLEARELTVAANHAANDGGGIYASGGPLAIAWSRDGPFNCPAGAPCNRISGNTAARAAGAMLLRFGAAGAHADLRQIVIENNRAETGSALLIRGSSVRLDLEGALISGQEPEPAAPEVATLILVAQGAHLRMSHVSIADNPGHAATVLNNGGQLELYASLLSEDGGIAVETAGGGSTTARCLLASEIASLPSHGSVRHWPYSARGGLFRNPDAGDHHPGPASPALDFCDSSFTVYPNDLYLGPRGRDLPWIPNRPGEFGGPYDLGAIEDHDTLFLDRFEFD